MPRFVYGDTFSSLQGAEQNYDTQRDARYFNSLASDRANRQMALNSYLENAKLSADAEDRRARGAEQDAALSFNQNLANRNYDLALSDRASMAETGAQDYALRKAQEDRLRQQFDFQSEHYNDPVPITPYQREQLNAQRSVGDTSLAGQLLPEEIDRAFPGLSPEQRDRLRIISETGNRQRMGEAESLASVRNEVEKLRLKQASLTGLADSSQRAAIGDRIKELDNYYQATVRANRDLAGSITFDPSQRRWVPVGGTRVAPSGPAPAMPAPPPQPPPLPIRPQPAPSIAAPGGWVPSPWHSGGAYLS